MKHLFKYLNYISIIFLVILLYKFNYLSIPAVLSFQNLILSYIFLFIGFLLFSISWHQILRKSNIIVSSHESFLSLSLTIFTKYIPGKVFTIAGPASYINKKRGYSFSKVSVLVVNMQVIVLWVALLYGFIGLININSINVYGFTVFTFWILLTLLIYSRLFHDLAERMVKVVFKKEVTIPFLSYHSVIHVSMWVVIRWLFLSIAFYFFVKSLSPNGALLNMGLALPLATAIGILVIFVPCGIGVREGVLASYLALNGFGITEATTIAVSSRLWLIIGELIVFLTGWLIEKKSLFAKHV